MNTVTFVRKLVPAEAWIIAGFATGAYGFGSYILNKKSNTVAFFPAARSEIRHRLEGKYQGTSWSA